MRLRGTNKTRIFSFSVAQFSGHAVIPSIVRDMQDHTHYESMLNWAFVSVSLLPYFGKLF